MTVLLVVAMVRMVCLRWRMGSLSPMMIIERVALGGVALERGILLAKVGAVHGQGDGAQDILEQFGAFADVVESSGVERLDGNLAVIDGGDDDDHGVWRDPPRILQDVHAGDAGACAHR